MEKPSTVRALSAALRTELRRRAITPPGNSTLDSLFEGLYYASLRTEEARKCTTSVVYVDPTCPDPSPPPRIRQDRWRYVRLEQPIEWTDHAISKVAHASDPRTSSFAVYPDAEGILKIWGLVDQQNRYHDFVNYHSDTGPQRPGLFQAETIGAGHIRVSIGYERIAELRINRLMDGRLAVFEKGPVLDRLRPGIAAAVEKLRARLAEEGVDLKEMPAYLWTTSLCRLILRIQNYGHGGALLITPDTKLAGLKVRHGLGYTRFRSAIENRAFFEDVHAKASEEARKRWMRRLALSTRVYFDEAISDDELADARSELDGAIWFVSLLSRVDGLVLLTPEFDVVGFGVEINVTETPPKIFVASLESGVPRCLRPLDYEKFGTRHRSMIRYCAMVAGSVGVVISQDDDVRIVTSTGNGVVVWENIKLQLDTPERRAAERVPQAVNEAARARKKS